MFLVQDHVARERGRLPSWQSLGDCSEQIAGAHVIPCNRDGQVFVVCVRLLRLLFRGLVPQQVGQAALDGLQQFRRVYLASVDPTARPVLPDWILRVEAVRRLVGRLAFPAWIVRAEAVPVPSALALASVPVVLD